MTETTQQFLVVAKSSNTNSFGLYQMILVAKDGTGRKSHASMYNAKEVGELVDLNVHVDDDGHIIRSYFTGHEMTTKLPSLDKKSASEMWKDVVKTEP